MKPTIDTRLNLPVFGPKSRQVRALRMTMGLKAVQSKNEVTSKLEKEQAGDASEQYLSRTFGKFADSCTIRSYAHTSIHS